MADAGATFAAVGIVAFLLGAAVSYAFSFRGKLFGPMSEGDLTTAFRRSSSSITNGTDYAPVIILAVITLCFTGGLAYIIKNQLYADDKEKSKSGIKNAIGVSWGLFVFAAILIPFALNSAKISADSKYYLMASLFTFYFSTLAAILIFFDKLYTLPENREDIDFSITNNTLLVMFVALVGYAISGVLLM
jgi:magnesium-transporting ATPase (P-type)